MPRVPEGIAKAERFDFDAVVSRHQEVTARQRRITAGIPREVTAWKNTPRLKFETCGPIGGRLGIGYNEPVGHPNHVVKKRNGRPGHKMQKVREMCERYPNMTATDIAKKLKFEPRYVRTAIKQLGLPPRYVKRKK